MGAADAAGGQEETGAPVRLDESEISIYHCPTTSRTTVLVHSVIYYRRYHCCSYLLFLFFFFYKYKLLSVLAWVSFSVPSAALGSTYDETAVVVNDGNAAKNVPSRRK